MTFDWIEKQISFIEINTLLQNGYDVEIDSCDGFVPINQFVHKGMWKEYKLILSDGREVSVNENHLFETINGWKYAKDLCNEESSFLTDSGYVSGKVYSSETLIPIVDISVEHENHRYYANGISSHNTAVGKSLALCHIASSYFMQGKNVLYITLEMSEARIAERIDANLLNISLEDLSNIPKDSYDKKIKSLKKKTVGRLIIKEYPTASASVTHFRALLNELNLKSGFVPDAIFVDYLNIAISSRLSANSNANSYTYVKSIAEELRGLSVEFNLPIWTATQTNRQGYTSTDIGLENTSESFGLPATADFMLALSTSEELDKLGQILIKQLKNRYNDVSKLRRFVVGIDRSKMRLFDLEKSAQSELIDTDLYKKNSNGTFDKTTSQKPQISEANAEDFEW
jgi:hypothetical protein